MTETLDVTVRIPHDIARVLEVRGPGVGRAIIVELALALLAPGRISPSQARRMTDLSPQDFEALLEERHIPRRYDVRDPEDLSETRISLR
jgi:predicted HTH domain antitoxin